MLLLSSWELGLTAKMCHLCFIVCSVVTLCRQPCPHLSGNRTVKGAVRVRSGWTWGPCAREHQGFPRFGSACHAAAYKGERGCRGCRTAEPRSSLVFGRCSSFVALQRFLARHSSAFNSFHPIWVGLTFSVGKVMQVHGMSRRGEEQRKNHFQ